MYAQICCCHARRRELLLYLSLLYIDLLSAVWAIVRFLTLSLGLNSCIYKAFLPLCTHDIKWPTNAFHVSRRAARLGKTMPPRGIELDAVLDELKPMGKYQMIQTLLYFVGYFSCSYSLFSIVFTGKICLCASSTAIPSCSYSLSSIAFTGKLVFLFQRLFLLLLVPLFHRSHG